MGNRLMVIIKTWLGVLEIKKQDCYFCGLKKNNGGVLRQPLTTDVYGYVLVD